MPYLKNLYGVGSSKPRPVEVVTCEDSRLPEGVRIARGRVERHLLVLPKAKMVKTPAMRVLERSGLKKGPLIGGGLRVLF